MHHQEAAAALHRSVTALLEVLALEPNPNKVDENTLTWPEGLRMLLDILPNADEVRRGV